tara:strand:+ start:898 stop:1785 length:888 start_codon:yes stop_codon:yes gene_type:complete
MVGAVNGLMDKVSKDVLTVLPKKAKALQDMVPKELDKIKDKIPTPESIKSRICESGSMDTAKKMYNQLGGVMDKFQNLIDKIKGLLAKLNAIISKVKSILESILAIAVTLQTIIDILKTVITAFKALVNGLQFIPSTAVTPIPVGAILIAKDGIKVADDKVKLFSNVLGGIIGKINFILPKLIAIMGVASLLDKLPNLPQSLLSQSKNVMDQCMKDELVNASPPAESLGDGVGGEGDGTGLSGVDAQNQTLDSLIDKENKENKNTESTTKIEEWDYEGFPKTQEYNVRTIPTEEF